VPCSSAGWPFACGFVEDEARPGPSREPAARAAAEVLLTCHNGVARCSGSSLMPQPYGVRGGWRATFTGGVLEYAMRAGFTGQGPATLTEFTTGGERPIDLPEASPPYAAVIGHVLACLHGHAGNLIEPASALAALELTLDVHQRLTQAAS
jgi:hypothetical protein